jgi:hypothetical protein
MSNTVNNTPGTSTPDPAKLCPEAVIAQLRTIQSQIEDVSPWSKEQRKLVKQRLRAQPRPIVEALINVIGVLDNVSQAIGQPIDEVRQLQDDSLRNWRRAKFVSPMRFESRLRAALFIFISLDSNGDSFPVKKVRRHVASALHSPRRPFERYSSHTHAANLRQHRPATPASPARHACCFRARRLLRRLLQPPGMEVHIMKKKELAEVDLNDDLRPEYPAEFFRNMKPNRFAGMHLKFKGKAPIRLDEDVAEVFDTSEAVNTVLRSAIKAMRTATVSARVATKGTSAHRVAKKRRAS